MGETGAGSSHPPEPWRAVLSLRLAQLTAVICPFVLVPIALGTEDAYTRVALLVAAAILAVGFGAMARRATPARARSIGVVIGFGGIGVAGYATVGFLSAPGIAFAISVAVAGLLLGRTAMIAAAAVTAAAVTAIGAMMVSGVLPAPTPEDISPELARPWLRGSAIMVLLIALLGATVTWVVEAIEGTLARLDEEATRREKAERHALRAHQRELMVQLAGGLAHDVNNQLTVISAWASMLQTTGNDDLAARAKDAIETAVDNASALTKQLLVLGRRDARSPRPLALGDVVHSFGGALRGFLPDNVSVRVCADAEAWCFADEAQINNALLNLALNGRDAMPEGGTLSVGTESRITEEITPGTNGEIPPGTWSILYVEDTGVGMSQETLGRVFEPFFTTKTGGKGSGLGLATIAAIVEHSGGHVTVDSELGRGTRVECWLPEVAPAERAVGRSATSLPELRGARILLADDTPGVLAAAREALAAHGCAVVVATDGSEALRRLDEGDFDVLCSDVVMPGAPVAEIIDVFARSVSESRVLLCSGYVPEDLVRLGIEEGRYHFLAKPYSSADLVDKVARVLAGDA